MMHFRDVKGLCALVRQTARDDLAQALQIIADFVVQVISQEASRGRIFSSIELDRLCLELGRDVPASPTGSPDHDRVVFLVTAIANTGGHSRVLRDLAWADGASKPVVLVTNTYQGGRQTPTGLFEEQIDVESAPKGNLAKTLHWVQTRLAFLRPIRTYILQHHFDPVCVAAAQPDLTGRLFYYHNCDHNLALGVHLEHATHVDFNNKSFFHCRESCGVRDNVYWPLTADVSTCRTGKPFLQRGHITTCTSGGYEKFDTSHLSTREAYLYEYQKLVPSVINWGRGTHIHIGFLRDRMLEEIYSGLSGMGIERSRFIYRERVPDLSAEFTKEKVDAYLGSFPLGGGRAMVEAMGSGLPLILHSNYRSVFLTDVAETYPTALVWRTPEELKAHIEGLTPDTLGTHSQQAREHYIANHTSHHLKLAVEETIRGGRPQALHRPRHQPDALQSWLDSISAAAGSSAGASDGAFDMTSAFQHVRTKDLARVLVSRLGRRAKAALLRR